jgi:azurin
MLKHTAIFASLFLTAAVAACSRVEQPSTNVQASAAPAPATAPVASGGRRIEIIANDTMKFSIVEIHAKAGERLSVTLVNQGATPKFSMGHNWILVAPSADVDAFLTAAAESATTDYVPSGKRAEILAATKLLGPGEQDTATFVTPAISGRYPFLCSYPGHAQVGMRGVLIVE